MSLWLRASFSLRRCLTSAEYLDEEMLDDFIDVRLLGDLGILGLIGGRLPLGDLSAMERAVLVGGVPPKELPLQAKAG